MIPAPALAADSTSIRPASMIFMSATMVLPGKSRFNSRTASRPSLLIRGVPASTQSTPAGTARSATPTARCKSTKSSANCKMADIVIS